MNNLNIYTKQIQITPQIKIKIPTIGEILEFGEDEYFNAVTLLSSTPYQMMVPLDDAGIDFSTITEFELFESLFSTFTQKNIELFMPDISPENYIKGTNTHNGEPVLYDSDHGIIIDKFVCEQITATLRKTHGFKKENKTPGNKAAREYMVERARKKQERAIKEQIRQNRGSYLENQIVALVNCRDFKYDFESIKHISIYALTQSIKQIERYLNYNQTMQGIYSGNVDAEKIKLEDIYWLS